MILTSAILGFVSCFLAIFADFFADFFFPSFSFVWQFAIYLF